jgi:hypothetical protein
MKQVLSLLLFLLLSTVTHAQFTAYAPPAYSPQPVLSGLPADSAALAAAYPRRSTATKIGAITMATGGAVIIVGVLGLVTPWARNHDVGHGEGEKNAAAFAIAGGGIEFAGILVYMLGKDKDRKAKHHYEMLLRQNKVGVTFNF